VQGVVSKLCPKASAATEMARVYTSTRAYTAWTSSCVNSWRSWWCSLLWPISAHRNGLCVAYHRDSIQVFVILYFPSLNQ
jgi:hypothetical protein